MKKKFWEENVAGIDCRNRNLETFVTYRPGDNLFCDLRPYFALYISHLCLQFRYFSVL